MFMADQRFHKRLRLTSAADYDRVFANRNSASDRLLVVYAAANDVAYPRLGLAVSRKVGNSVARNRWKRAIREAFRLTWHELPAIDLVCLPRPAAEPELIQLRSSLRHLAQRVARRLDPHSRRGDSPATPSKHKPQ